MVYLYDPIAASTVLCKQKTFNQTWHLVIGHGRFPVLGEMQEEGGEGGNGKRGQSLQFKQKSWERGES